MSEISFRVKTDWQEVEKLIHEIDLLKQSIQSVDTDLPRKEIDKLNNKLTDLRLKYEEVISYAARANAELSDIFNKRGALGDTSKSKEVIQGISDDMQQMQSVVSGVFNTLISKVEEFKRSVNESMGSIANVNISGSSEIIDRMGESMKKLSAETERQGLILNNQAAQNNIILTQQQQETMSVTSQVAQSESLADKNHEVRDTENEISEAIEKSVDSTKKHTEAIQEQADKIKEQKEEIVDFSTQSVAPEESYLDTKIRELGNKKKELQDAIEKLSNTPAGSDMAEGLVLKIQEVRKEIDGLETSVARMSGEKPLEDLQEEADGIKATIDDLKKSIENEPTDSGYFQQVQSLITDYEAKLDSVNQKIKDVSAEEEALKTKTDEVGQSAGDTWNIFKEKDDNGNVFRVMGADADAAKENIEKTKDSLEALPQILQRIKEKAEGANTDFGISRERDNLVKEAESLSKKIEGRNFSEQFGANGELIGVGDVDKLSDLEEKLDSIITKEREIEEEKKRQAQAEEEAAAAAEQHKQSTMRLRTQIMNAREEMAKLIREGKMGTPEFQELARNAGSMRKEMQLSSAAMNYYADPNRNLHTLKTGLQGVAGAAGLVTSTIGLFNEDSKKMAEIQTKVQSVLGIVVGLETTYNLIKKSSNVMLAIEEVKTWALTKARVAQTAATESAAVAQEQLNVAMMKNPIGAIIALLAILVAAIFAVVKAINSETEAEKKLKEMRESNEEVTRKAAITAERNLGTYEKLRKEWEKQGTILEKREQFIKDNKKAFEDLGLTIYDVKDAEKAFGKESEKTAMAVIEHTEKIVKERKEWGKEAASTAAKQIMSYKKLQDAWEKLGNNLTQKNKFIKKNKNAFHELGMEVNTVKDAENVFSQNTDTIIAAFRARAEAAAYSTAIMKEYEKQLEMELNGTYENGGKIRKLERNEDKRVKIGDTKEKGGVTRQEIDKLIQKYGGEEIGKMRTGAGEYNLTDEMIFDINNWRAENAKAKQKSLIDKSNARIKELEKKEEEAIKKQKKIIEAANIEYYEGEEDLTKEILAYKQRMYDLQLKQQEDALEQQRKAFNAAEDERIAAIEDANEREEEARKNQYRLNLEAIKKQEEAYKKANVERLKEEWSARPENKERIWANTNVAQDVLKNGYKNIDLTDEQKSELKSRENKVNTDEAFRLKERVRNEQKAVVELLKVWGDYEEKRWAITQEYAEKRRVANTSEEKAALTLEENKKLEELKAENEKEAIDWDGIFSSFEGHTKSYLEGLRDQLQGLLSSGDITDLTQLQTIQEKLREINEEINKQGDMFSFASERQREHTRLVQEAVDAEKRRQVALQNENTISSEGNYLRFELARHGVSDVDLRQTNAEILKGMNPQSPEYKQMEDILNKLRVNEGKLADARKKTAKATTEATNAEDAAHESLDDAVARHLGNINEWAQTYLGDLPELMDELGFGEAGKKVQAGLNGLNDAAGAAQDFASGNYVSAALKGISAFKNFSSIFGGGSNEEVQLAIQERISNRLEDANRGLDKLTEQLAKNYGLEAQRYADESKQNLSLQREEAKKGVQSALGTRLDGYKHYTEWYLDRAQGDLLKNIVDTYGSKYGVSVSQLGGKNGYSWKSLVNDNDLNNVAKMLKDLRDSGSALWSAIGEGMNGEAVQKWLEILAETAEKEEQIEQQLTEQITGTTKEKFFDDWKSNIKKMVSDTRGAFNDISNGFDDMINDMIINNVIGTKFKANIQPLLERLQKIQEEYDNSKKTAEDRLKYEQHIAEVRKEYNEETVAANKEVHDYKSMGLLKDTTKEQQSSTFNSAQNITYEQGDSIAGSLINHSMLLENGNQNLNILNVTAESILSVNMEARDTANDARDILAGMAIHVQDIRDDVRDVIVPAINNIDDTLTSVKRIVENQ